MKIRLVLISCFVLLVSISKGQLIKGSIRPGAASNQVEVWIMPTFDNSTTYMAQILLPIAIPAGVSPLPTLTTANVTLDAGFISTFGNNYAVTVYAMSNNTTNTEKYFSIALVRNGAGNSNPQTWTHNVMYKVLTATFQGSSASAQVKLADYQDGGVDGQGNFYAADASTYFYDFGNSANNFFSIAGQSSAGGDMSAGFAQTNTLISLPVNLLNFSGYKSGTKNILNWRVAGEINNRGFDVLRSTDGTNYTSLGFVNSQASGGFSNTELSYTFTDNNPVGKKQFYRLNQKDIDGNSKLSNIVMITGDKPGSLEIGGLFPNPARDMVNVIINTPQKDRVTVVVTDMSGKIVKQQQENVDTGANTVPVEIASLASGSYLVKLICKSSDCQTASAKFNKQ